MKNKFKNIFLKLQKKNEEILSKKPLKIIFWTIFPILSYFAASYFSAVIIRLSLALIFWNNDVGYQSAASNTITTTIYWINACDGIFYSNQTFQAEYFER